MALRSLVPWALISGFFLVWEAGCRYLAVPDFILPPPTVIIMTAVDKAPLLFFHAGVTLLEILLGTLLSVLVAIPVAIAMFSHPAIEKSLTPLLVASQAIPVFAVAPLLVVWFGYGLAGKILMAAVIIFFPITVSLLAGFKSCDREYRILFRLMGAGFWQTLRMLYWPWALPHFFTGLKVGVSVATIGAVIGEWVGAQRGLGFLMIQANARLRVDLMFAAILYLSVMGLGLWIVVDIIGKRAVHWR